MRTRHILFGLVIGATVASHARAASVSTFSVQGILRDNLGQLQSMALNVTVNFYNVQTGGTLIRGYVPQMVAAQNGLFTVNITDINLAAFLQMQSDVWLELSIQGIGTFPRQLVTAGPYAMVADRFASALEGDVIGTQTQTFVTRLRGVTVANVAPNSGQVLQFNAGQWTPTTIAIGVSAVTASAPLASSGGSTPNISLTGVVPIANGGTGSSTKNFVDLTTDQTIGGLKDFNSRVQINGPTGAPSATNARIGFSSFAGIGTSSAGLIWSLANVHEWWSTASTEMMSLDAQGLLHILHPSQGRIVFANISQAEPTSTSPWRIVLFDGAGLADYGFGVNGLGRVWGVGGGGFDWYTNSDTTTFTKQMSLNEAGNLVARGTITASGTPDLAETIAAAPDVVAGDVVCADPEHAERVVRCRRHDRAILGVISDGSSSFLINSQGFRVDGKLTGRPLVLAGRVPVKVSLENGPIEIGDPLVPSSTPGVAMRAREPGPTVGIALSAFDDAKRRSGNVLCFVKVGERGAADEFRRLRDENAALRERVARLERAVGQLLAESTEHRLPRRALDGDHLGARSHRSSSASFSAASAPASR